MKRTISIAVLLFVTMMCAGCPGDRPAANQVIQVTVVNDRPLFVARLSVTYCGHHPFAGATEQVFQTTDTTGRAFFAINTGDTCPVPISLVCGSGAIPILPNPVLLPASDFRRTINCGFSVPVPSNPDWGSLGDSIDMIHLDRNPTEYSQAAQQAQASSWSPYDEANRESVVRSFLGSYDMLARESELLYRWLLDAPPPNGTVLQNLQAGQFIESQVVLIAAGGEFFALSNNNHTTFVVNLYKRLLDREPMWWEVDSLVQDLDGYWMLLEEECQQNCYWFDGAQFCDEPPPPPPCGQWVWIQRSRQDVVWEVVASHEHHQVLAKYSYGVQLRRQATASEIETQAYHVAAYGLKEGAVRLLKSGEFFNKTTQPW